MTDGHLATSLKNALEYGNESQNRKQYHAMASHNPWCVSPVIAMPTRMMTNLSARVAMPFFTSKPTDSARARAYDVTNDVIIDTMLRRYQSN